MTKEELGALIIQSEDAMYHVAKTLLYNDVDCADAISEAIVKAFSGLSSLREDRYAKTWLIRILINECYAVMRRERRVVLQENIEPHVEEQEAEKYSELYEALARLSEDMRLTVSLYYLESYSVKEIAQLLETTESTIKNRLFRARKILRKDLEKERSLYVF